MEVERHARRVGPGYRNFKTLPIQPTPGLIGKVPINSKEPDTGHAVAIRIPLRVHEGISDWINGIVGVEVPLDDPTRTIPTKREHPLDPIVTPDELISRHVCKEQEVDRVAHRAIALDIQVDVPVIVGPSEGHQVVADPAAHRTVSIERTLTAYAVARAVAVVGHLQWVLQNILPVGQVAVDGDGLERRLTFGSVHRNEGQAERDQHDRDPTHGHPSSGHPMKDTT
ncbi:MAG TPA: hypothetical protein PK668_15415 [Myxococcota bacterium]|nr:hypothetical protein [Myxococcota bacterium]HRY94284.1 hypothetical protein [Myxococcota bacterium]